MKNSLNNDAYLAVTPKRIDYWDLAAGLMILWIIICHAVLYAGLSKLLFATNVESLPFWMGAYLDADGHICMKYLSETFPYIMFAMPWFFYKSGYFFKKQSYKELFIKDFKKLLIPFIIWGAAGYLLYLLFGLLSQSLSFHSATYSVLRNLFFTGCPPVNVALWFLLTLFLVRQFCNILLPNKEKDYSIFNLECFAIVVSCAIIGFILYNIDCPYIPYWVANTATGMAFFIMGYWLKEYQSKLWLILPCTIIYVLSCILGLSVVIPIHNTCSSGHYLLFFPQALTGIVTLMYLCTFIARRNSTVVHSIMWIGEHAMYVFVTHYLICMIVYKTIEIFRLEMLSRYSMSMIVGGYVLLVTVIYAIDRIRKNKTNQQYE